MNAHIWTRCTAAISEHASATTRLEETKEAWEQAKSTRDERQRDHDEAERAAALEHPADLPAAKWKSLQGLYADRTRAEEAFEVLDRARRKMLDLVKTLGERILKLNFEAFGDEPSLKFDGKSPPWQGVELADFMGDLIAQPFLKAGVRTLADAKAGLEGTHLKQMLTSGEITTEQHGYLKAKVIERLDAFAVEHKLGKAKRVDIPEMPKGRAPTPAQAEAAGPVNAAADAAAEAGGLPPQAPPNPYAHHEGPIDLLAEHDIPDRAIAAMKKAGILRLSDLGKPLPGAMPGCRGRLTLIKGVTPGDEQAIEALLRERYQIETPPEKHASKPKGKPAVTVVKPPRGKGARAKA